MTAPACAIYSSASDNWPTPREFYDRLDSEFGFTLDVCSSVANHKAPEFYALDHPDADVATAWPVTGPPTPTPATVRCG